MIAHLRANPNVRYVIVYALSRFARNRYDDAIMMMTSEKLGVTLVSTTERNLDESPPETRDMMFPRFSGAVQNG